MKNLLRLSSQLDQIGDFRQSDELIRVAAKKLSDEEIQELLNRRPGLATIKKLEAKKYSEIQKAYRVLRHLVVYIRDNTPQANIHNQGMAGAREMIEDYATMREAKGLSQINPYWFARVLTLGRQAIRSTPLRDEFNRLQHILHQEVVRPNNQIERWTAKENRDLYAKPTVRGKLLGVEPKAYADQVIALAEKMFNDQETKISYDLSDSHFVSAIRERGHWDDIQVVVSDNEGEHVLGRQGEIAAPFNVVDEVGENQVVRLMGRYVMNRVGDDYMTGKDLDGVRDRSFWSDLARRSINNGAIAEFVSTRDRLSPERASWMVRDGLAIGWNESLSETYKAWVNRGLDKLTQTLEKEDVQTVVERLRQSPAEFFDDNEEPLVLDVPIKIRDLHKYRGNDSLSEYTYVPNIPGNHLALTFANQLILGCMSIFNKYVMFLKTRINPKESQPEILAQLREAAKEIGDSTIINFNHPGLNIYREARINGIYSGMTKHQILLLLDNVINPHFGVTYRGAASEAMDNMGKQWDQLGQGDDTAIIRQLRLLPPQIRDSIIGNYDQFVQDYFERTNDTEEMAAHKDLKQSEQNLFNQH